MSAPEPTSKNARLGLAIEARVTRWRVPSGLALDKLGAPPPLGVRVAAPLAPLPIEQGDAVLAQPPASNDLDAPTVIATLVEALPDPRTVAGAPVVVLPTPPATGLLARLALRRVAPIPRALRGAALLLRGYRSIGGGVDPRSGLDLVWGEP
jgi:hypothetical protein